MFGKQEKEVVFIETVMGLAQRRRHCLVECIPLPQDIARQAPLYFKKVNIFIHLWIIDILKKFSYKGIPVDTY